MKNESLDTARIEAIIHYLLLTRNIDSALKKYEDDIMTPKFIVSLIFILKSSLEYPEFSKNNALKIASKYADLSKEPLEELKKLILEKETSNDIYETEFLLKNNTIDFDNKDYFVWTLDDMETSLENDILFIDSLMTTREEFGYKYLDHFMMNPHFLYSVNKFAYIKPYIFDEETIIRIVDIININREIITLKLNKKNKTNDEIKKQQYFYKMNTNTIMSIMNLRYSKFSLDKLKYYYQRLGIEEYIFNNDKLNTEWISRENVYNYIDMLENIDKPAKNNLLFLLDSKKEKFNKEKLIEYNNHLRKLNSLDDSIFDHDFLDLSIKVKDGPNLNFNRKKRDKVLDDIKKSNKKDLEVFKLLISSNDTFNETLDNGTDSYYIYSIIKFIKEMPSIFLNYDLNNRARYILNKYVNEYSIDATKTLKKMIGE